MDRFGVLVRQKIVLPICAASSAFASGSLATFEPGGTWYWVLVGASALFAGVMALVVAGPTGPQDQTGPVSAPARSGGFLWRAISVGLLLYVLIQIYLAILLFIFSGIAGTPSATEMQAFFATVPAVGGLFAIILGAGVSARFTRPFLGAVVSSLTLLAIVVVVQITAIAFGQTSQLQILGEGTLQDVAVGFILSWAGIMGCLLIGVAMALTARKVSGLLFRVEADQD